MEMIGYVHPFLTSQPGGKCRCPWYFQCSFPNKEIGTGSASIGKFDWTISSFQSFPVLIQNLIKFPQQDCSNLHNCVHSRNTTGL
mmetsp:Transcript_6472/g.14027  ORF Transcript_6472/g.14027 Transcript_6472/m.14027 type:complete len:85 (+) Transcript_6472:59-313(+)